jgi:hypothetical protein
MPPSKLEVLRELLDEDGVPAFAIRRWDREAKQYVWLSVPIPDDELRTQLREPVRLSHDPKYWLYRNRFVLEEDTNSEPDEYVDALHAALEDESNYHLEGKARVFSRLLGDPPGGEHAVMDVVRRAMMGIFPKRYSDVSRERPEELVLRIKHAVLTEERAFEKLRREVAAFEAFERLDPTPREPIPEHVKMFVWQRDEGRCVKCGSQERLEYDHVIALAKGGSNTERNLQLLCEACNRAKGSSIV